MLGLVHGNGGELRTAIGNLSAPMVPLFCFYVAIMIVLHGHFGGAYGWPAGWGYDVQAARI